MTDEELKEIENDLSLVSEGDWYVIDGRLLPLRLDIFAGPKVTDPEIREAIRARKRIPGLKAIAHQHIVTPSWFEQNENTHDIHFLCKSKSRIKALLDEIKKLKNEMPAF